MIPFSPGELSTDTLAWQSVPRDTCASPAPLAGAVKGIGSVNSLNDPQWTSPLNRLWLHSNWTSHYNVCTLTFHIYMIYIWYICMYTLTFQVRSLTGRKIYEQLINPTLLLRTLHEATQIERAGRNYLLAYRSLNRMSSSMGVLAWVLTPKWHVSWFHLNFFWRSFCSSLTCGFDLLCFLFLGFLGWFMVYYKL